MTRRLPNFPLELQDSVILKHLANEGYSDLEEIGFGEDEDNIIFSFYNHSDTSIEIQVTARKGSGRITIQVEDVKDNQFHKYSDGYYLVTTSNELTQVNMRPKCPTCGKSLNLYIRRVEDFVEYIYTSDGEIAIVGAMNHHINFDRAFECDNPFCGFIYYEDIEEDGEIDGTINHYFESDDVELNLRETFEAFSEAIELI